MLCGEREEKTNHIIAECSKLSHKVYYSRHDGLDKVIHRELCKKFKLDHMNKWYMHKLESARENETQNILWDFEMQTDHIISTRGPDLMIVDQKRELAEF